MHAKDHWENVYASKQSNNVSWFQVHAEQSMRLIRGTGLACSGEIIEVGGGASTLVDDLLQNHYSALTVLDLSASALSAARLRLGALASRVRWIEGDITKISLPLQALDI